MFIRSSKKSIKGKIYTQQQLMTSVRTPLGPRQQLIFNLGKLTIPKSQFKILANRIEEIISHQSSLFPCPDDIEALSRHFADQIIQKNLNPPAPNLKTQIQPDYALVNLNSLLHSRARFLGAEYIILHTIEQLQLPDLLKSLSFTDSQISYTLMLIIARMVSPGSERHSVDFIKNKSALPELLNTDIPVYDNALHRTACQLLNNKDILEKSLSKKTCDLFQLNETIFLYDLTNTYFEGRKTNSQIAGFGRSKEKRNDRPLLTLALVVDQMGFPKQSRILSGACVETETIPNLLDQLQDDERNWLTPEKTIVIDAGMASDKNLALIRERGFHYVAVSRKRKYPENFWDSAIEENIPLSDSRQSLTVQLIKTETECFLLCKSPYKLIKEQGILTRRQQKFENALKTLNENLSKKRTIKQYDKILEKIGRLKQQYQVGHLYTINVQHQDNLCTHIDFQKKNPSPQKPPGEYVLRTSRLDLSASKISEIHRSLTTIEDSFSSMKGHLGLRPNFHHTDEPTIAHIFITVLAYHIMSVILKKLKNKNINHNWTTLREILSTHVRLTTTMQTEDQKTIHIRSNTRPDERQTMIYNALGITHDPIGPVKAIHPINHKCSDENPSLKNSKPTITTTY